MSSLFANIEFVCFLDLFCTKMLRNYDFLMKFIKGIYVKRKKGEN